MAKQCGNKKGFPYLDALTILIIVVLVIFSKQYDFFLIVLVALEAFLIGWRIGAQPCYLSRFMFWRKS